MLYAACCLLFTIIIGGAVYEHMAVVPQWAAAPPLSLSMFQGEYGLKAEVFWKTIHPINLIFFVLTLATHWRTARRKNIVIVLTTYLLILVITAIYFVPELISITTTPYTSNIDAELIKRSSLWEVLSLIRLAVLCLLAIVLLTGLTKSSERIAIAKRKTKARNLSAETIPA